MANVDWAVLIFMSPGATDQLRHVQADIEELRRAAQGRAEFTAVTTSLDGRVAQLLKVRPNAAAATPAMATESLDARAGKPALLQDALKQWLHEPAYAQAKKMVVLWGHAQGVASALSSAGNPLYTSLGRGGFGYSPVTGDALTAQDIATAIDAPPEGGEPQIDILAFDSCFMSTSEAAYELRGKARYLLASQSAIPLAGFDYTALGNIFALPSNQSLNALEVATELMKQVGDDPDAPRTLALISLHKDRQEAFRKQLAELSDALIEVLGIDPNKKDLGNRAEWIRVRAAFEQASWQQVRQFIDLADLCRRLTDFCRTTSVRNAARAMSALLQQRTPAFDAPENLDWNGTSLVLDTRSAPPWLFGGLSIYCGWLLPTPAEGEAGAWNAAVRQKSYEAHALFDQPGSACRWHKIAWDTELLGEGQRNALYRELDALRSQLAAPYSGNVAGPGVSRAKANSKPPDGGFFTEERTAPAPTPRPNEREAGLIHAQSTSSNLFSLPLAGLDSSAKR